MTRFLVVLSDYPCGRGSRGMNLYRFLARFHGPHSVQMISTRELLASEKRKTDVLFIGVPTKLSKAHLANVSYRQAVLFDYQDDAGPRWLGSDRDLLMSISDVYLKPWVEESWDFGLQMGVLPIRRHRKLAICLRCRGICACLPRLGRTTAWHDVAFIGNATAIENRLHQRIEWIREIKAAADRFSFWGGIAANEAMRVNLQRRFSDLTDLCYPHGRVGFLTYFRHLTRSRVALAPAGNARWSYRHYEAIYAGAVVVTTDFRHVRTLIPLPRDRMIHVPDHAPVLPAIEAALEMRRNDPGMTQDNVQFLERYLHYGDYCRGKPELMDRFLAQLAV